MEFIEAEQQREFERQHAQEYFDEEDDIDGDMSAQDSQVVDLCE